MVLRPYLALNRHRKHVEEEQRSMRQLMKHNEEMAQLKGGRDKEKNGESKSSKCECM